MRLLILCAYLAASGFFTVVVCLILTVAKSDDRDYLATVVTHDENGYLRGEVSNNHQLTSAGFPPFF
jgi:hypothetical protein